MNIETIKEMRENLDYLERLEKLANSWESSTHFKPGTKLEIVNDDFITLNSIDITFNSHYFDIIKSNELISIYDAIFLIKSELEKLKI